MRTRLSNCPINNYQLQQQQKNKNKIKTNKRIEEPKLTIFEFRLLIAEPTTVFSLFAIRIEFGE